MDNRGDPLESTDWPIRSVGLEAENDSRCDSGPLDRKGGSWGEKDWPMLPLWGSPPNFGVRVVGDMSWACLGYEGEIEVS